MIKTVILTLIVIACLTINSVANAQAFVQSRYIGSTANACTGCDVLSDGVLHVRFQPTSEGGTEVSNNQVKFVMQIRKLGGEIRSFNEAAFIVNYNNVALGDNLNDPPFYLNVNRELYIIGQPNPAAQCAISTESVLDDDDNVIIENILNLERDGDVRYAHFYRDNSPAVNQLGISTPNIDNNNNRAAEDLYSSIGEDWKNLLEITCTIPDGNADADAGIAISGTLPADSRIRAFLRERLSSNRVIFALADNDLRGLRLDGKTWAEDYFRYGDGDRVRLRFSKGIDTVLTPANFSFDVSTQTSIVNVNHESGSPDVEIIFSDIVENDILRLASTVTNVIRDKDGETLAPGNFVASLFYDAGAPAVTTNVLSSGSEHTITFSDPITVATAIPSNLCIAEADGLCADDPEIPITNVEAGTGTTSNQITLTIDSTEVDKEGAIRSIVFRRNAVYGPDLKIVEDFQQALQNVINIPDTIAPVITITNPRFTISDSDPTIYTIQFDVDSDEPVPGLNDPNSYTITVDGMVNGTTRTEVDTVPNISSDTSVVVRHIVNFDSVEDVRNVSGWTLNIRPARLEDSGNNPAVLNEDGSDRVARLSALACASFYPNIGQQTLYFQLDEGVALTGGELTIDDETVGDIGSETFPRLSSPISQRFSVDLGAEITSDMAMIAVYTVNGEENEADCLANLTEDMDDDTVPDIVDSSPFNVAVATLNPETTGGADRAFTPSLRRDGHFSRETVIRSLIGEGEFTFVDPDPDFSGKQTFERISSDEYFGINTNDDTQIFRYGPSKGECEMVLDEALEYNLNKVKIDEFCQDNRVFSFANESPRSKQEYIWVTVVDEILQVSTTSTEITTDSGYFGYNLSVLPEINFLGQSSYIFSRVTTPQTVVISAFRGTESNTPEVDVRARSTNSEDSTDVELTGNALIVDGNAPIVDGEYTIASPNTPSGETIVHWLAGAVSNNSGTIWAPTSATANAMLPANGYDISGFTYAIGSNNNIDVRVAGSNDPEITRIRQILLYEIRENNPLQRVSSVIADRSYYVIADFDTNSLDEISIITDPMLVSGYTDTETSATQLAMRIGSINFIGQAQTAIEISQIVAPTTGTGTITVGWSRIGNIPNIRAVYLVSPDEPPTYNVVDGSAPIFSTAGFNQTNALPVDIVENTRQISNNDILSAHGGDEDESLPVFFTHYSYINADNEGGGANDYSATIAIADESDETRLELEGSRDAGVRLIATFGVRDVDYGFNDGDSIDDDDITGGTIYATFPIRTNTMDIGSTLYVGKYGRRDDRSDGDSAEGGTWYVIKRENLSAACPTNLQFYINNQEPVDENGGFSPSADNCIMLVITDGGIFDASSREGIIIDPVGISNEILPSAESILETSSSGEGWYRFTRNSDYAYALSDRRRRGGGGGAIGTSDALLLVGALVLLLIGTASRRRRTLHNS